MDVYVKKRYTMVLKKLVYFNFRFLIWFCYVQTYVYLFVISCLSDRIFIWIFVWFCTWMIWVDSFLDDHINLMCECIEV